MRGSAGSVLGPCTAVMMMSDSSRATPTKWLWGRQHVGAGSQQRQSCAVVHSSGGFDTNACLKGLCYCSPLHTRGATFRNARGVYAPRPLAAPYLNSSHGRHVVSMSSTFTYDVKTEAARPRFETLLTSHHPKVSYHFNEEAVPYHFGTRHPMKPFRLMLTDHLVLSYGLHSKMDWYKPRPATEDEILEFHNQDYIDFLQRVTPPTLGKFPDAIKKFNIGPDCPIFDGLYRYASICAGGSLDASRKLVNGQSDIAINWSGGLHHAKKFEASGFCYINDIVLGILNLLREYPRILYIDIDVHHGDGVQEAFYLSDRVMTLSFHKYDGYYFPGTGDVDEIGAEDGKHYSLNVPLQDGIDDDQYTRLFKSVLEQVLNKFRPAAIVLQCGADSLGGDRLGGFNLNIRAHAECVKFTKSFGIPMMVLGGGGYTPRNVSRLWGYETAVCLDTEVDADLPKDLPFYDYFAPDHSLFPPLDGKIENKNTREYLEDVHASIMEKLRYLDGAPSVAMQVIPPDIQGHSKDTDEAIADEEEDRNMDIR